MSLRALYNFFVFAEVDYARALKAELREERSKVMLELEKEKHVLRQMQGKFLLFPGVGWKVPDLLQSALFEELSWLTG